MGVFRVTVELRSTAAWPTWYQLIDAPVNSELVRQRMRERAIFDWVRLGHREATVTAIERGSGRRREIRITAGGELLAVTPARRTLAPRSRRLPAWSRRTAGRMPGSTTALDGG